jgi:hypothetical protein
MRKLLFHLIIIFGAISNAITMTVLTSNVWIVMGTTAAYVIIFEAIFIFLKPRLILAERKRNLRKFPELKKLIETEKSIITLTSGETIYNASFVGYSSPKETKQIEIEIHRPKQAKKQAYTESKSIFIHELKSIKAMKK